MTSGPDPRILQLRSFNERGMAQTHRVLADLAFGREVDLEKFITNDDLTEIHSDDSVVLLQPFENRFKAAQYFNDLLAPYEKTIPDIERNAGLWTWLAFCWIDLIAPAQGEGRRKLGEWRRWILSNDRKRHRHLLATPYRIYRTHVDELSCILVVLCGPVETPGNITEQIASRQDIVKSRNIMKAITEMYYIPELQSAEEDLKSSRIGQLRVGAPTSAARLGKVLGQFYLTWDMFGMEPKEIMAMLPPEFEGYKKKA